MLYFRRLIIKRKFDQTHFDMNKKSAFSLLEVSIVILIIGLLTFGVITSKRIIASAKINGARKTTAISPLHHIPEVALWLDATHLKAFDEEEPTDGDYDSGNAGIATWYDINPHARTKRNATAAASNNEPKYYRNCINQLPCLRFDGSDDYFSFDPDGIENVDYSIFIVERRGKTGQNPILGRVSAASNNTSIEVGYTSNNKVFLSQGNVSGNSYDFVPSPAIPSNLKVAPRLHSFISKTMISGSSSVAHYLNGDSSASNATLNGSGLGAIANNSEAYIGINNFSGSTVNYQGDIGEIIIITRALNQNERKLVEQYLIDKWGVVPR